MHPLNHLLLLAELDGCEQALKQDGPHRRLHRQFEFVGEKLRVWFTCIFRNLRRGKLVYGHRLPIECRQDHHRNAHVGDHENDELGPSGEWPGVRDRDEINVVEEGGNY